MTKVTMYVQHLKHFIPVRVRNESEQHSEVTMKHLLAEVHDASDNKEGNIETKC